MDRGPRPRFGLAPAPRPGGTGKAYPLSVLTAWKGGLKVTADGTTVDLYDCNNTAAQVFIPQSNGSLYNPQSGECLDDTGWSTTPGTQLQIWDCTGHANQQWSLP